MEDNEIIQRRDVMVASMPRSSIPGLGIKFLKVCFARMGKIYVSGINDYPLHDYHCSFV